MTETIRLRCSGREYALTLDLTQLMGDTVEDLEEHLGGEGLIAWVERFGSQMERGVRVRDLRSRDIIALVFIARSQAEPGITWQDVARSIAPYTLEIVDEEPPSTAPAAAVGIVDGPIPVPVTP